MWFSKSKDETPSEVYVTKNCWDDLFPLGKRFKYLGVEMIAHRYLTEIPYGRMLELLVANYVDKEGRICKHTFRLSDRDALIKENNK